MIQISDIEWRTCDGETGDCHTLLVGKYKGLEFSELFDEDSFFGLSLWSARRKITRSIRTMHGQHFLDDFTD